MIKTRVIEDDVIDVTEKKPDITALINDRKNARTLVERNAIDDKITLIASTMTLVEFRKLYKDAGFKLSSKYTPHQGNRERLRRLARIYHSHPHDCPCKSCEMMDGMLKSRGRME